MSAPRRVLLALVCALVCAACRIDTQVAIDVRDDGSGTVAVTVRFDADAVARTPDLATALRTDDLTKAGWEVRGPERQNGAVTYVVTKPFASADQLATVLGELTGPKGVFRDVALSRSRSFGSTTWTFRATADLSAGVDALTDTQLGTALDGRPLGRDRRALEAELGGPLESFLSAEVALTTPDGVHANTTTIDGRTARWTLTVGDPAPHALEATSTHSTVLPRLWAIVAGAAAFVLLVVLAVRALQHRRPLLRAVDGGDEV